MHVNFSSIFFIKCCSCQQKKYKKIFFLPLSFLASPDILVVSGNFLYHLRVCQRRQAIATLIHMQGQGCPQQPNLRRKNIMRINHNIAALNTYRQLASSNNATSKSLEKLSSGFKINRPQATMQQDLQFQKKMRAGN